MEKDLVDNGTAGQAIINSIPASGKVSFEGNAEQKIRTETGKTEQTIIECKSEIRKSSDKLVVAKTTSITKATFGATGLTVSQEVELQAQARIHVDQTLQEATITQSEASGSTITSTLNNTLSVVQMTTNNKVKVKLGSLIIEVVEGNPVVITLAGITVTVPLHTKALIEEPVDNTFKITNISDTDDNPDAGNIIVTTHGESEQIPPGGETVKVAGIVKTTRVGGQLAPVNVVNVLIPWIRLAMGLAFASLLGLLIAKK
ncbi:MAG: hypothetical protein JXA46_01635, partial [Dehalococcoidales bacterium]|nr:hypothetical protein [Dehalococcoidales bacterium]